VRRGGPVCSKKGGGRGFHTREPPWGKKCGFSGGREGGKGSQ